jgi:hypothetical protein
MPTPQPQKGFSNSRHSQNLLQVVRKYVEGEPQVLAIILRDTKYSKSYTTYSKQFSCSRKKIRQPAADYPCRICVKKYLYKLHLCPYNCF